MQDRITTLDVLQRADALLPDERSWCKGRMRTYGPGGVMARCLWGAVTDAALQLAQERMPELGNPFQTQDIALQMLMPVINECATILVRTIGMPPPQFNDSPYCTFVEVKAMLRLAMERLRCVERRWPQPPNRVPEPVLARMTQQLVANTEPPEVVVLSPPQVREKELVPA